MKRASIIIILAIIICPSIRGAQTVAKNEEDCGCDVKTETDTLAIVNGVKITVKDVEGRAKEQVEKVHAQVIEARKQELNFQINSKLLEREAKKRGVSTIKLLEAEVVSKVKDPTEAEAQAFYEQNKARIQGEFK